MLEHDSRGHDTQSGLEQPPTPTDQTDIPTEIPSPRPESDTAPTIDAPAGGIRTGRNEHSTTTAEIGATPSDHAVRAGRLSEVFGRLRRGRTITALGGLVVGISISVALSQMGDDDKAERTLPPPPAVSESLAPTSEITLPPTTTALPVTTPEATRTVEYVKKLEDIAVAPGQDVTLPERGATPQQTLDNLATTLTAIANSKDEAGEWRNDLLAQFVKSDQEGYDNLKTLLGDMRDLTERPESTARKAHIQFELAAAGPERDVTTYPRGGVIDITVRGLVVGPDGAIKFTFNPVFEGQPTSGEPTVLIFDNGTVSLPNGRQEGITLVNLYAQDS